LLESTPARADTAHDEKPLALSRGAVASDLRADFPELGLWLTQAPARVTPSPEPVRRRLDAAGDRVTGAEAIGSRSDSTPWAYRVFARRVGIDPDDFERDDAAGGTLPADAQLIAAAETGVRVLAFDADRLDGEPWLRRAIPGERIGDRAIEPGRPVLADRTRVLAMPFGEVARAVAPTEATERMAFVALQVKGVPDVGVEEALWTVVEISRSAR
jgi:hypothetical protein